MQPRAGTNARPSVCLSRKPSILVYLNVRRWCPWCHNASGNEGHTTTRHMRNPRADAPWVVEIRPEGATSEGDGLSQLRQKGEASAEGKETRDRRALGKRGVQPKGPVLYFRPLPSETRLYRRQPSRAVRTTAHSRTRSPSARQVRARKGSNSSEEVHDCRLSIGVVFILFGRCPSGGLRNLLRRFRARRR